MARLGYTGLIITEPEETFLCLGLLDNLGELIEYRECQNLGIPIIRRETGGGAVLLSRGQVFYQLILPKSMLPFRVVDSYKVLCEPVLRVYRRLGLPAEYRPINDIVVGGKKISGQGAGDIGRYLVFVGNILIRFDTRLMARLFRLPHESLRSFVKEALEENMTWLERELKRDVSYDELASLLVEEFSKSFDFEEVSEVPEDALMLADRLKEELTSEEFLFEDTGRRHRLIKVREGVFIRSFELNGKPAGLLIEEGVIKRVFGLSESLEGLPYEKEELLKAVEPELVSLLIG